MNTLALRKMKTYRYADQYIATLPGSLANYYGFGETPEDAKQDLLDVLTEVRYILEKSNLGPRLQQVRDNLRRLGVGMKPGDLPSMILRNAAAEGE